MGRLRNVYAPSFRETVPSYGDCLVPSGLCRVVTFRQVVTVLRRVPDRVRRSDDVNRFCNKQHLRRTRMRVPFGMLGVKQKVAFIDYVH